MHRARGLSPSRPRPAISLPASDVRIPLSPLAHFHRTFRMREMKLQDLKTKTPAELVSFAEELEVENAITMRKQELMFGILKQLSAARDRYRRRRRGRGLCRTASASCARRKQTICPARTTSTSRPRRSAASACAPATPSTARSAAPRKASAISRCSRSTRSISRIPRRRATRSTSTI